MILPDTELRLTVVSKVLLSTLFKDEYKSGPSQIPDAGNLSVSRYNVSRGTRFFF